MAINCIQVVVYTHLIYHCEGGFHFFFIARPECVAYGSGDEEVEIPLILPIKIPQRLGDLDARPE